MIALMPTTRWEAHPGMARSVAVRIGDRDRRGDQGADRDDAGERE